MSRGRWRYSERLYAIIRYDAYRYSEDEPEQGFTVKQVVDDIDLARAEAARLNRLNGPKGARYSVQVTRLLRDSEKR